VSTRPQLAAEHRTVTGKKVATLRRSGILPAVVYGRGHDSEPIQVAALDWEVLRRQKVGRNTLLDLKVDGGKARPVLVHGVSEHPVSRRPVHLDFYVVKMTEEMAIDVPLVTVGEAAAVDKQGGTLLHLRDAVHIRALPADLPTGIEVDISPLVDFDTVLHVSDLVAPSGVTILTDPAEPILRVQAPRVEEEPVVAAAEEAPAEAAEEAAAEESAAEGTAEES
jgi:large subunit ribosomal protein L25